MEAVLCGFSFCVSDLSDSHDTKNPQTPADSEVQQVTEKDGGAGLGAPTGDPQGSATLKGGSAACVLSTRWSTATWP